MHAVQDAHKRRRMTILGLLVVIVGAGAYATVGTGHPDTTSRRAGETASHGQAPASAKASAVVRAARPVPPLEVIPPGAAGAAWRTTARVHGLPAAWLAERSGATLMRFDQSLVHLTLHAGILDGGESGWTYGDRITQREIHSLVAGFNGGFKLTYSDVGFLSGRHTAVPLKDGLASIVTYTDGTTEIGSWRGGVPSSRKVVYSVLQNQHLLVDRGVAAASVAGCVLACWGGRSARWRSSRARDLASPPPESWCGRRASTSHRRVSLTR